MAGVWSFLSANYLQLIDIVLVAALFYYLLVYVRGTKTALVLEGIVLLSLLYFACQYLKLITLVFILEKVLFVGPLALFIIFAPEIRQVLEHGSKRSRLFAWVAVRHIEPTQSDLLGLIIDSSLELAENRTGALIAIEGSQLVDEFIVPGTVLEAVPSQRLLSSLFDRHNPLHDGAVIFRGERLHFAGSFLPISESTWLDESLGTRHRAAVGLTERCDAVVIVVSEERGALSIAYHGRIAQDLSHDQYIEQLRALVEPNENFSNALPRGAVV